MAGDKTGENGAKKGKGGDPSLVLTSSLFCLKLDLRLSIQGQEPLQSHLQRTVSEFRSQMSWKGC